MASKNISQLSFLRYYDKVVVVAALIVLLISLAYLVTAGVAHKQREADYLDSLNKLKPASEKIVAMDLALYSNAVHTLQKPPQVVLSLDNTPNFLAPECRVKCVGCARPIPFSAKACPFCGKAQPEPPAVNPDADSSGDGIPDKVKIAWGLDPRSKDDVLKDPDGDGFNYLDEYRAKTDPKDAKSHPAYATKLSVKEIKSKRLPLRLTGVNTMPGGKTQLVFYYEPKRITCYVHENEPIKDDRGFDTGYTAGKVTRKTEKLDTVKQLGYAKVVDASTVEVTRNFDKKQLTVRIGEVGKFTDVVATLTFQIDNTELSVLEKQEIKLRDETYRVMSIHAKDGTVTIENTADGKSFTIQRLD